jgi:hypothetical protein
MRIRETISHEEIIIYGIHLEAKICTKIFTTKSPGTLVSRLNYNIITLQKRCILD